MTFVKSTLAAAVIAVASFSANADTTFNLGDVTGTPGFGASNNGSGAFVDTINFSLTSTQALEAILFNFSFSSQDNVISGFEASLLHNGSLIDSASITSNFEMGSWTALAGDYTINLSGDFGSYGTYDVDAVLAPVPEPATYALMLGGLGLVGFMAARRRKLA